MRKTTHLISDKRIDIDLLNTLVKDNIQLELAPKTIAKIKKCRNYLDGKIAASENSIYGVTTGFGSLYDQLISAKDQELLQIKLVLSHAAGIGDEVPEVIVKMMLFLKIQSLSYGFSAISINTIQRLIDLFNEGVLPVVYQQGSLGASGDLAPLAHLALPLIGKGEVNYKGSRQSAEKVLKHLGWKPIHLQSKEGLALLNGTQFMSSYGVCCLVNAMRLSKQADLIAAMTIEAFNGRVEPFDELLHKIRPHKGQQDSARLISQIRQESEILASEKKHLQDPYSIRCVPQVHGASKDALNNILDVFLIEINSVTDNPTVFPDEDKILSGGNFHGQPLALNLDFMSIALAELGSISERRIFKLLSGQRGLPPYLIANPGLNSGFMIAQYTAASIVSQNKQFCTPASIDTIDSSNGQEDHVSMGANAATKLYQIVNNIEKVLAIELYAAAQALDFRKPLKSSPIIENWLEEYRKIVPFMDEDKMIHEDIAKSITFLKQSKIQI